MEPTGVFLLGFAAVAGVATALATVYALFWTVETIVQFLKRYRQSWHPRHGIGKETVRERVSFALHAAIFWPRV